MLVSKSKIASILLMASVISGGFLLGSSVSSAENSSSNGVVKLQSVDEYGNAKNIHIKAKRRRARSANADNLRLARVLAERLRNHPDTVDISDIYFESGADFNNFRVFHNNVIAYLEYADPDMYAFRGNCSIRYNSATNQIWLTNIQYEETLDEHNSVVSEVDRIVSSMPKGLNNAEKVLWVNNYLVTNAQYDSQAASATMATNNVGSYKHAFTPYGVLLDKKGVCESYAKSFSMIMKRLDIPNYRVRSDRMRHTWNIVKVNDKWYNIDVTWNDPVGIKEDELSYNYFLKSDENMMRMSMNSRTHHYGADEDIEAANNTDRDNNPFNNEIVKKPMIIKNKFFYFKNDILNKYDRTRNLRQYKVNENQAESIFKKLEGLNYKDGDKQYIFNFNKDKKVLEMYNVEDLSNPVGTSEKIDDFEEISLFRMENKPLYNYNYIVDSAEKTDDGVRVRLMKMSNRWNPVYNQAKNVDIKIQTKEENPSTEKPEAEKPKDDNLESGKTEDEKREAEKREAENREVERREAERREAERREAERREAEKREAEKREAEERERHNTEYARLHKEIYSTKSVDRLVDIYNNSFDKNIRNEVVKRFEVLEQMYMNAYKETYDVKYGNEALKIKSILNKDTSEVYSISNLYSSYITEHNNYVRAANNYNRGWTTYENVLKYYNRMKNRYSKLSESYRSRNKLPELVENNDYYGNYFGNYYSYRNMNRWNVI